MNILQEVRDAWGWVGIDPQEVVLENDFGNLILKDSENRYWRLSPEDVYCEVVAESTEEYKLLVKDEDFLTDWFMSQMVQDAEAALGPLSDGQKYYMVIPGLLGGAYGGSNIQVAPLIELIRFSGNLGKQLKDLPEGAEVQLKVVP